MSSARTGAALAAGAVALAATTLPSGAAFVDQATTAQPVAADHVSRWLGLEVPGAGTCAAPADSRATGEDSSLAAAVGGTKGAGRRLDCVFVVHARDTLPDGVEQITVTVSRTDPATSPVTAAALTALDGSGAGASTTLAAGARAAVRLDVGGTTAAAGELVVTVTFAGEQSGFLRYRVPVAVCAGDLQATCAPPDRPVVPQPEPQAPPAPATGAAPSSAAGDEASRRCLSRRWFTIRVRRSWHVRTAAVRVNGKVIPVRRRNGRLVASVDLRGMVKRTVVVRIAARSVNGRALAETRTYRTCLPKPAARQAESPTTGGGA